MAINYTTLFTRLGKLVKWYNSYLAYQGTTLLGTGSGVDEILDQYNDRRDLVPNLETAYLGFVRNVAGWESTLKAVADTTLSDLQPELNSPSSSPSSIIPLLASRMVTDGQSVQASTVSTPTITPGTNTGNGVLIASTLSTDGVPDQRGIVEALTAVCTNDAGTGGTSGGEVFSLAGYPVQDPTSYKPRGSGSATPRTANSSSLTASTGNFDTFASNVPNGWAITAGTAGTHVAQETVNVHRGLGALKLLGAGSPSAVTLNVPLTGLTPKTVYALSVWIRKGGTTNSGSNLLVAMRGTGLSDAPAYNADPSTLTTSYAHSYLFFVTPSVIPSNYRLEISWTTVTSAGTSAILYLDDAMVIAPTNLGFVNYAVVAGSTDFVRGDSFGVVTSNNYAGVFQTWLNRVYQLSIPSDPSSPTLSDSLAV